MQAQIEQRLGALISLPLWAIGRAADLAWFQFGGRREVVDDRGRTKTVGDWALHVQCAWRLMNQQGVLVADPDVNESPETGGMDEVEAAGQGWSLERGGRTRLDERIAALSHVLNVNSPVVVTVQAEDGGGLRMTLSSGYVLEIRPEATGDDECWRLFEPYRGTPHLVVSRSGAELG